MGFVVAEWRKNRKEAFERRNGEMEIRTVIQKGYIKVKRENLIYPIYLIYYW